MACSKATCVGADRKHKPAGSALHIISRQAMLDEVSLSRNMLQTCIVRSCTHCLLQWATMFVFHCAHCTQLLHLHTTSCMCT